LAVILCRFLTKNGPRILAEDDILKRLKRFLKSTTFLVRMILRRVNKWRFSDKRRFLLMSLSGITTWLM